MNADPRARLWTRLERWAAVVALGWCAARLARGIGPLPFYNSDSAVPILLMRGLGDGPFTLYYPGQDRYGMWPFLAARALHLVTPEAMHVVAVLFLCAAAAPLALLLESPALAVGTLLFPVVLNAEVAWNFFQAGQPYLWQVATLLWAWAAVRLGLAAEQPWRRRLALVAAFAASLLSIWISTLSIPALLVLLGVEAVRARSRPARLAGPLVALVLAGVGEAQIRGHYYAFCRRVFGQKFLTVLRLDRGHLAANVVAVLGAMKAVGIVFPLLVGLAALPLPGRTRTERCNQLALVLLALLPLPAYVVIAHFRENLFGGRYFSLPAFWAVAAAACGAMVLAGQLAGARRGWVRLGVLLVLMITIPGSPADPLGPTRSEAAQLVGPAPRILLGDYWAVYVPASLAPPGMLLPLPREGSHDRFPALEDTLRPGRTVLASCALDAADGTMRQYGALLRRAPEPPIVAGPGSPWCLHTVEEPAPGGLRPR